MKNVRRDAPERLKLIMYPVVLVTGLHAVEGRIVPLGYRKSDEEM